MKNIIILALLLAFCLPAMAQTTNMTEIPDMVGNWTGIMDSVGWAKNTAWMPNETVSYWPNGEETLMITEQNESMFSGMIVPKMSPGSAEVALGIIGSDNSTINMVDEDGIYWGELMSPTKMELFYQEVGTEGMVISAGIFEKM